MSNLRTVPATRLARHPADSPAWHRDQQVRRPDPLLPDDVIDLNRFLDAQRAGAVVPLGAGTWPLLQKVFVRPIPKTVGSWADQIVLEGNALTTMAARWSPTGARAADALLEITRSETVVRGLRLSLPHLSGYTGPVVYVHDCDDVVLEDITILHAPVAIRLERVNRVSLRGIRVRDLNSFGFLLLNATHVTCTGCQTAECIQAAANEVSMNATDSECVIAGNDFGATGVIAGVSLGANNRPVLGDTSFNVCGAVT